MRKLTALLLTSVLGTGAVANADTVTVTTDPGNLINIIGIHDEVSEVGDSTALLVQPDSIEPSQNTGEAPFYSDSPVLGDKFYKLELELMKSDGLGNLDQASICFFDGSVLNSAQSATTCGSGVEDDGNITGQSKPQSALQIGFFPEISSGGNTSPIQTIDPNLNSPTAGELHHDVRPALSSGGNMSKVTLQSSFDGSNDNYATTGTLDSDSVYKLDILFRPTDMAKNTEGWKIRVLSQYKAEENSISDYEEISDQLYTVKFSNSITVTRGNSENQIDFAEVVAGGSEAIEDIDTATYRANDNVDLFLIASQFEDSDNLAVDFGTASTELGLSCGADQQNLISMQAETPLEVFSNINSTSESDFDARTNRTAAVHDCTLAIGSDMAAGSYGNVMTIAVDESN